MKQETSERQQTIFTINKKTIYKPVATKVTRRPKDKQDSLRQSGDHSKVEPPGPVPNPEVKHFSADGSWAIGPVRVGRRQFICPLLANAGSGLFLCPDA